MNDRALLSSRVAECNANSQPITPDSAYGGDSILSRLAQSDVGQGSQALSDEEREQAICRAGSATQSWYSRYQQSQDSRDLDMAYRFLSIQLKLIQGRS